MTFIEELINCIGARHVLTLAEHKMTYEIDVTGKFRSDALAVVKPRSTNEVAKVIELANEHSVSVIPMGGNTGLRGGCFAGVERDSIILSVERLSEIIEIDKAARTLTVGAGAVVESVNEVLDQFGLVLPISLGAKNRCQIGGVLSTNAIGRNVVRYGSPRSLCLGLEAVMPNGKILEASKSLTANSTASEIKDILIGAEGTLGVITRAIFRLYPKPQTYDCALVSFADLAAASSFLELLRDLSGGEIESFEYIPGRYFDLYHGIYPARARILSQPTDINVLVELGMMGEASREDSPLKGAIDKALQRGWVRDAVIAESDRQRQEMRRCREAAIDVVASQGHLVFMQLSLPVEKVNVFLKQAPDTIRKILPNAKTMEFAHLGHGTVHFSVWQTPSRKRFQTGEVREIYSAIEYLSLKLGGVFSPDHGVARQIPSEIQSVRNQPSLSGVERIKFALDPKGLMNPGKVVFAEAEISIPQNWLDQCEPTGAIAL